MKKTKIDWCDCTINPVVGCPNKCPYCYARKINDRFHIIEKWDEPQFFADRLKQFESKTPKSVFIDSMSDAGCWQYSEFEAVMNAALNNPQHKYIVLTKKPKDLLMLRNKYCAEHTKILKGVYLGASITTEYDVLAKESDLRYLDFLSIEPLLSPIKHLRLTLQYGSLKAIIIGAETGNRKHKVVPEREWVDMLVGLADQFGQAVFMKESLRPIMGSDFRQDRLPWEIER